MFYKAFKAVIVYCLFRIRPYGTNRVAWSVLCLSKTLTVSLWSPYWFCQPPSDCLCRSFWFSFTPNYKLLCPSQVIRVNLKLKKLSKAVAPKTADYSKWEIKFREDSGSETEWRQAAAILSQNICSFINADGVNSINSLHDHHSGSKQLLMPSAEALQQSCFLHTPP